MGHKYAIPHILEGAITRLRKYYPQTLEEWDNLEERRRRVDIAPGKEEECAITTVNLAHLTNTPELLPAALFVLCRPSGGTGRQAWKTSRLDRLPEAYRGRLLNGRDALARCAVGRFLSLTVFEPSRACEIPTECIASGVARVRGLNNESNTQLLPSSESALASFFALIWMPRAERLFPCSECRRKLAKIDKKMRREVWDSLAKYFDLEEQLPRWGPQEC